MLRRAHLGPVIVLAAIVIAGAALYDIKISPKMPDFDVYWRAAARAAAGEPLYRADDGHYQFKYLPAFAVLASPLTALAPSPARALWFALSLSSLVGLVAISLRLWPERPPAAWLVVALTLVVLGKFYAHELLLGQDNALFGLVLAAAILAMVRDRETVAGALVALGIVLKPYGLLLAPWLLLRGRWRSVGTFAAGLVVAACLPLLRYPVADTIALHEQWWATVRDTTAPNLMSADNVSWLAMFTKWSGGGSAATSAWWIVTALCVFVALLRAWSVRAGVARPERLEGSVLLLLVPLVSPQGWDYVLLLGTPCVVALLIHAGRLPAWLRIATFIAMAIMGLTLYDVMGRDAYQAFQMRSGLTLCSFVLLAAAVTLRMRRAA